MDIYARLVKLYSKKQDSNKELDELKNKYAELEKKFEKLLSEQSKNNAKDETIRSLEEALKERDKELNAKEKEIASFKMASISYNTPTKKETANDTERKINKLLDKPYQNPLTVREYNKIFKLMENIDGWDLKSKVNSRIRDDISLLLRKYPDPDDEMGYFKLKRNLKQLRRYYEVFDKGSVSEVYNIKILMDAYAKELKEKRSDLSENAPFYGSVGAVLAGLIGTSIYLNFYDYVAAGGIGLATSGLICGTLGALHDHINARGHDNVYPMSIFGSLGGAIAGPISYALFNFWENTGNVDWFNGIQGFPDLLAKSMLGGVAATIALLALIAAANSKN